MQREVSEDLARLRELREKAEGRAGKGRPDPAEPDADPAEATSTERKAAE